MNSAYQKKKLIAKIALLKEVAARERENNPHSPYIESQLVAIADKLLEKKRSEEDGPGIAPGSGV